MNSVALPLTLCLLAVSVRARPGGELSADQKYYPGGELARGFGQGGLSPWRFGSGDSSSRLEPAGADSFAGVSMEYRAPLHGSLSGVGFFDVGWTRLGPAGAAIEPTNRVLRASTGAELRLQLPYVRQPARLIFAWNPLRLDTLVQTSTGPLRVADPRRAVRFAFGEIF